MILLHEPYSRAIKSSIWGQSVALTVLYSSVVQALPGLKFAAMANGEPSAMLSGTTGMQVLYADSLDSHRMVKIIAYNYLEHCDQLGVLIS
jgi:hypothetical protein